MSDPEFFYSAVQRQCGTCTHWGKMTATTLTGTHYVDGPNAQPVEGVIVRTCGLDQRPGLVVNGIGWCKGSDKCSRWVRS
jgi:hypothetical protein